MNQKYKKIKVAVVKLKLYMNIHKPIMLLKLRKKEKNYKEKETN